MFHSPDSHLIVRAGTLRCALPLGSVREVMRPLLLQSANGLAPAVLGISIVRGDALPVVSLPGMLGQQSGLQTRFVVVRTPRRDCVLAVDGIEGIAAIDGQQFEPMSKLLQGIEAAETIAALDRNLIVTLNMALVAAVLPQEKTA